MSRTISLTAGKVFNITAKIVHVERTVLLIGELESSYKQIADFLGYEPKVEFENGKFAIKIKGLGKLSKGTCLVKVGTQITEALFEVNLLDKYEIISEYVAPPKEDESEKIEPKK